MFLVWRKQALLNVSLKITKVLSGHERVRVRASHRVRTLGGWGTNDQY